MGKGGSRKGKALSTKEEEESSPKGKTNFGKRKEEEGERSSYSP